MFRLLSFGLLTAVFGFSLSSHTVLAAAPAKPSIPATVWDVLKTEKDVSKFAELAKTAGLEAMFLSKDGRLTVFAPSNAAMDKISSDTLKRAKENKDGLKTLALHHVIDGSVVFSTNIKGRRASPSAADGGMIGFDGTGKTLKVEGASIVSSDLKAGNGVVHVLDAALIAESLVDPKIKEAAREKEEKAMREEMEKREAAISEEMKKREAESAKDAPSAVQKEEGAAKPAPAPASGPAPAAPVESKEKKGLLKSLFGL